MHKREVGVFLSLEATVPFASTIFTAGACTSHLTSEMAANICYLDWWLQTTNGCSWGAWAVERRRQN